MTHSRSQSQEKVEATASVLCCAAYRPWHLSTRRPHPKLCPQAWRSALRSGVPESAWLAQAQIWAHLSPCLTRSCYIGGLVRLGVFTLRQVAKRYDTKQKHLFPREAIFKIFAILPQGHGSRSHLPASKEDTSPLPGTR